MTLMTRHNFARRLRTVAVISALSLTVLTSANCSRKPRAPLNVGGGDSNFSLSAIPTNLVAVLQNKRNINVTWVAPQADVQGYYIERRMGSGGTYHRLTEVDASTLNYTDTTTSLGYEYSYRVVSHSGSMPSEPSEPATLRLPNNLANGHRPLDANGDGKEDLMMITQDGREWIGTSNGASLALDVYFEHSGWAGVFNANSEARFFSGDFDGNGTTEVFFTWENGTIWVSDVMKDSPTYKKVNDSPDLGPIFKNSSAARFFTGDFNGDGKTDLGFTWVDGSIWVGLSNGTTFNFSRWLLEPNWVNVLIAGTVARVFIGDFNGDGKSDFCHTWNDGNVWFGISSGTAFNFYAAASIPSWGPIFDATSLARFFIGDFDGNGVTDLAFAWTNGAIHVSKPNATGGGITFPSFNYRPEWTNIFNADSVGRMRSGDFNGDGKTDILLAWNDGNIHLAESDGERMTWRTIARLPTWGSMFQRTSNGRFFVGDFTGDGKHEFGFTWPDGTVYVGENRSGTMTFTSFASQPALGPAAFAQSAPARVQIDLTRY